MTDNEIIEKVKTALKGWAFADIKKASDGGAKVGAFILASCLIDYLASYYSKFIKEREVGNRIKDFIGVFLRNYDPNDLYISLRNKLVHNYSEGGRYLLTDGEKAGKHLSVDKYGKILINLENFISEIEEAMNMYFARLDKEEDLRKRCIQRYDTYPLLQLCRFTDSRILEDFPPSTGSSVDFYTQPFPNKTIKKPAWRKSDKRKWRTQY